MAEKNPLLIIQLNKNESKLSKFYKNLVKVYMLYFALCWMI